MKEGVVFLLISSLFFSCFNKKRDQDNSIVGDKKLTVIIDALPADHDFSKDVYLSGDFEGWSGGQESFKLEQIDKKYSITIPKYSEQISFKFTLGDWTSVECAENGNPIKNRLYQFSKLNDTIHIRVLNWGNTDQVKFSTAQKNVKVLAVNFEIPQLNRTRKISIYLPPNYGASSESYPVLYIQDGQNVFDNSTSYSGEWEVDETLNDLYNERGFELIVIAIDHGGDKRLNEYSPWDNKKHGQGEGEQYVDFLVNTLKPQIDASYRTKTDAGDTAIMGASLGGLISHYAAFQYPNVFGKAGLFSPSYWYAEGCFDFTEKQLPEAVNSKIYILVGGNEGAEMVDEANKMVKLLKAHGFSENQLIEKVVPSGSHSESFWKMEFEDAIKWMFKIDKDDNI